MQSFCGSIGGGGGGGKRGGRVGGGVLSEEGVEASRSPGVSASRFFKELGPGSLVRGWTPRSADLLSTLTSTFLCL